MDKFFTHNGLRFHYLDYPARQAGAPTLVFLPGLTANAHCVAGLVASGVTDHFRLLSLDFRGRGQSDKPETGYRLADYVEDVLGLLTAVSLPSAIICGHSFGGLVGMVLAAQHPEKVERFILADSSHLLISERTANLIKSSLDRLGVRLPSLAVYLQAMQQMPWLGGYWDAHLEAYFHGDVQQFADGSVQPRTPAPVIAQTIDHEFELDWEAIVAEIQQPCLLIRAPEPYGSLGAPPILPEQMAQETVAKLADCEYAEATGNHVTMLFGEHAANTVALVQAWAAQDDR